MLIVNDYLDGITCNAIAETDKNDVHSNKGGWYLKRNNSDAVKLNEQGISIEKPYFIDASDTFLANGLRI